MLKLIIFSKIPLENVMCKQCFTNTTQLSRPFLSAPIVDFEQVNVSWKALLKKFAKFTRKHLQPETC